MLPLDQRARLVRSPAAMQRSARARRWLPVAIAVFATGVYVMLTDGGSHARQALPVEVYLGRLLDMAGLGLREVTVKGQRLTPDSEIYRQLQLGKRHSVWLLDTEAARERIESLPWVLQASLKRVFPDRLHIDIRERRPHAVWNDGRKALLIDRTGRVLGDAEAAHVAALPAVFGGGAPPRFRTFYETISRMPGLGEKVRLYEWTANRRWTLHLEAGRRILLPASGHTAALLQITEGAPGERLIDVDFDKLDLRLESEVAIEPRKR